MATAPTRRSRGRGRLAAAAALVVVLGLPAAGAKGAPAAGGDDATVAFTGVHWSRDQVFLGSQIYLVGVDGRGLRRVTRSGPRSDSDPAWSPDGRRIAFGRQDGRGWRLHVMKADGTGLRALTEPAALADDPSWSPDGRQLVFAQLPRNLPSTGSYAQQLYVVAAGGGRARQLTRFAAFAGGAGAPARSPDGTRILFWGRTSSAESARTDVWSVAPDGKGLRRLITGATDPAWSPDGRSVAFVRGGDVYVAAADGKGSRRLTRTRDAEDGPGWSTDGSRIVFASLHRAADSARDTLRVLVVGADGGGLRAVTRADPLFWADAPAWRPAAGS